MLKMLYGVLLFVSSCSSSKLGTNMETTLEIDFQDFFKNDTVGFKFNECPIFTDVNLNSNHSTGLSSVILKIYKKGNRNYHIKYSGSSIECNTLQEKVEVTVIMNGVPSKFFIDVNAGKFIGFSKKGQAELYFYQSQKPFEYN